MPRTHRGPREISAKPPISRGSKYVAVCGASEATRTQLDAAREVGQALDSWSVKGLDAVRTPEEAVKRALEN